MKPPPDIKRLLRRIWLTSSVAIGAYCLAVYSGVLRFSEVPNLLTSQSLMTRQDISPNIVAHIVETVGRSEMVLLISVCLYAALVLVCRGRIGTPIRGAALAYQAVPPLVSAPLILLLFHVNERSLLIAGAAFVTTALVTAVPGDSLTGTSMAAFSRLLGQSRRNRLWALYIPGLARELAPAVALVWPVIIGVVVVLEYLGSAQGLGRALSVMVSYAELGAVVQATLLLTALVASIGLSIAIGNW